MPRNKPAVESHTSAAPTPAPSRPAELIKLARFAPGARALLRIRADDPGARCQLGNKYGAEVRSGFEECLGMLGTAARQAANSKRVQLPSCSIRCFTIPATEAAPSPASSPPMQVHEWEPLLLAARSLGVVVQGVAFHVGSGATHPAAFSHAIELARRAWDLGTATGFDMKVLDIGGGFQGGRVDKRGHADFGGVAEAVNSALAAHFPESEGEASGEAKSWLLGAGAPGKWRVGRLCSGSRWPVVHCFPPGRASRPNRSSVPHMRHSPHHPCMPPRCRCAHHCRAWPLLCRDHCHYGLHGVRPPCARGAQRTCGR